MNQRRAVLSEEDYQSTLEQIIRRDYFPDVAPLERQVALQNKREAGDVAGAVAIRRAARKLTEHEEEMRRIEDEEEELANQTGIRSRPRPLEFESLTGFHARVTSEDNAHFEHEQRLEARREQAERERRQELLLLTNAATKERATAASSPFLLASDQFNAPLNWTMVGPTEARNSFFFPPEDARHVTNSQLLLTAVDSTSDQRALMPPPAAKKKMAANKESLVEYIPRDRIEKKVEPTATRFPSQPLVSFVGRDAPEDSSSTEYATDSSTDLDSILLPTAPSPDEERRRAAKRRRREQETLVQMTPVIVPGRGAGGRYDASPIVTWGTVNATPVLVAGGDREGGVPADEIPSFSLPEIDRRERAAEAARAALEERSRKMTGATVMPSSTSGLPSGGATQSSSLSLFPIPKGGGASSAGGRSRPPSARSREAFGSALRSSYGGSSVPRTIKDGTPNSSRRKDGSGRTTPRINTPRSTKTPVYDGKQKQL